MPESNSQESVKGSIFNADVFPVEFTILAVCAGGWAKGSGKSDTLDKIVTNCKIMGGHGDRQKRVKVYLRIYLCSPDEVRVDDYGTVSYPVVCKSYALGYVMV